MTKKRTKKYRPKKDKQRKPLQRVVQPGSIKSSSKDNQKTGFFGPIPINDPINALAMPHETDKWCVVNHMCIPYTYDKNNKTELFVNFTKGDRDYILYWLERMENELCHKSMAHYDTCFRYFLQPINHCSTHDAVGSVNTTLTMIAGLRINFLRNGEEAVFNKAQMTFIEHVFWMAWWFLCGYHDHIKQERILSDKDVGFIKKSGRKNPPLMPIHFYHHTKELSLHGIDFSEEENKDRTITL
tara:strand:+ start:4164 stop:4889 length:726 start_codon:yes stop_codon:yes gene_type:complete